MYQNFISYLYKVQHVSVVGRAVGECVQQLHSQQSYTYAKSEAASAVLGS
jgi:hypothetical protein